MPGELQHDAFWNAMKKRKEEGQKALAVNGEEKIVK
jgi:hypothetical protein